MEELLHFQEVASLALPRTKSLPSLPNIDYHLSIEPFRGCVGGDHVAIVNFDEYGLEARIEEAEERNNTPLTNALKKNRDKIGILIADVAGHMVSDNLTVNYLHAAFKTAIGYELKLYGEVTRTMFEELNLEFHNRMQPDFLNRLPYLTLLYGEIRDNGVFRYLSAGHPSPIIFSNERDRVERLGKDRTRTTTPFGFLPSRNANGYWVNEIALLNTGDSMLLYTDGLFERCESADDITHHLERVIRGVKDRSAKEISEAIRTEMRTYCPPEDDVSLVVVKRR